MTCEPCGTVLKPSKFRIKGLVGEYIFFPINEEAIKLFKWNTVWIKGIIIKLVGRFLALSISSVKR